MTLTMLQQRAKILRNLRQFFDERGFIEVETPIRITAPAPEPFIDCPPCGDGFLRASPELQMKHLLIMGAERIYQIGSCFREGERGSRHNPEFTMLEWYRTHADYNDIVHDMEELLHALAPERFHAPFRRLSVREAYQTYAGWDPLTEWNQDRFDVDMATKIEPNLPKEPLFLVDYPAPAASLARLCPTDTRVAERWELYVEGMELANCFSELVDAKVQRERFEHAKAERLAHHEADYPLDEDFLNNLSLMPPSGGVALGIDRLVMVLCGAKTIDEVRYV